MARATPAHSPCRSIGGHTRSWAVVYTHAQAERWADANLRRLGYTTFLPLAWTLKRDRVVASMRHRVQIPLWPRYVLVVFDPHTASWSPIRACPGVVDLVRNGKEIPKLGDTAVEAVRSALQADEAFAALQPHGRLRRRPGEAVRLVAGVFAGQEGVVLKTGREMCLVSILMLGQLREVLVQADAVEARDA